MKNILAFLFILSIQTKSFSQNLITNGGFEKTYSCPGKIGDISLAYEWKKSNETPDLFSACANELNPKFGTPSNYTGKTYSKFGNNYAGLALYYNSSISDGDDDYQRNELIYCKLNTKIIRGSTYEMKLWVSLAAISTHYSNNLTASLYTGESDCENRQVLLFKIMPNKSQSQWIELQCQFTSTDSYEYVEIGLDRKFFKFNDYKKALEQIG